MNGWRKSQQMSKGLFDVVYYNPWHNGWKIIANYSYDDNIHTKWSIICPKKYLQEEDNQCLCSASTLKEATKLGWIMIKVYKDD